MYNNHGNTDSSISPAALTGYFCGYNIKIHKSDAVFGSTTICDYDGAHTQIQSQAENDSREFCIVMSNIFYHIYFRIKTCVCRYDRI